MPVGNFADRLVNLEQQIGGTMNGSTRESNGASGAYVAARGTAVNNLDKIGKLLDAHNQRFEGKYTWPAVGDIAQVNEWLQNILDHLEGGK